MTLSPGARLGPYEILAPIGAGGMGEVYRARDTRLDRIVAVKVLPPHVADRPELRQRFEREARAISSLNHPHIAVLHDIGEQDGIDYLVMEYLEGETLAARLTRGPLPLEQVLQYGIQIADALAQAHKQGVLHRDLKPGNIMLTKMGAKLLDFGLAKLGRTSPIGGSFDESETRPADLTKRGTILGTVRYMSPEQLNALEIDARSDIFSFGAVLYEMTTGRRAFEGLGEASVMAAILERDPPPISSLQPLTPPALERVVKRCLAKDPGERWQSARDLAEDLKWIVQSGAPTVAAAPQPARGVRWSFRLALAAGLAVAAFAAGLLVRGFRSEQPVSWTGIMVGGPRIALGPRISPGGQMLALQAMVNGLTQVAVMKPETGNWTVLTHER